MASPNPRLLWVEVLCQSGGSITCRIQNNPAAFQRPVADLRNFTVGILLNSQHDITKTTIVLEPCRESPEKLALGPTCRD